MNKKIISEKFLCEIWEKHDFGNTLKTKGGKSIEVLSKGEKNKELEGPDYLNAKIKIDNKILIGNIEIDTEISNWQDHKHHINKKYNNVILHIVYVNETNQKFVTAENNRIIPSVALSEYITPATQQNLAIRFSTDSLNYKYNIPCVGINEEVKKQFKEEYLINMGSKRFNSKRNKFFNRLKELSYLSKREFKEPIVNYDLESELDRIKFSQDDFSSTIIWEQLIYEKIFTALGYSKNKKNMNKLAKSVEIKLLQDIKNNSNLEQILEAVLFSISGLLPEVNSLRDEQTSVYARQLYELWIKYSDYDYGLRLHPASWNFFRMRPQNFPTVRIAGGARLLKNILSGNLIHILIALFETEKDDNKLKQKLRKKFIIKAEGYWQEHYIFDEPSKTKLMYLVGKSRADEIIINIILPYLYLYFEIFNKTELIKRVLSFYLNYQQSGGNKLVEDVLYSLRLKSNRSVIHQGTIHLYWNYCSLKKCIKCEIGKQIF